MARLTRKRWRRPERLTVLDEPVTWRKHIGAPDVLTLEPDLQQRLTRRRKRAMTATFVAVACVEGLLVGLAFGYPIIVAVGAALGLAHLAAGMRLGDDWIRKALGAEIARNPRLNRMATNLAATAGVAVPDVLVVRHQSPNATAVGVRRPAIVATTGSLNVDDLVLEGMVAQAVVRIRDGDAALASSYFMLGGSMEIARANEGIASGVMLALDVLLWPAGALVRWLRGRWFADDLLHRADVAGALLTRYPPGVEVALKAATAHGAPGAKVAAPFWLDADGERRAQLVGEM